MNLDHIYTPPKEKDGAQKCQPAYLCHKEDERFSSLDLEDPNAQCSAHPVSQNPQPPITFKAGEPEPQKHLALRSATSHQRLEDPRSKVVWKEELPVNPAFHPPLLASTSVGLKPLTPQGIMRKYAHIWDAARVWHSSLFLG